MHIADGILPVGMSIAADAAVLGLIYLGGKNAKAADVPRMGIFAAALFIVSLIHFPVAGTSVHLGFYGLAGLMFGLQALPILFVVLLFQALIFQHGGLLALGINTLTMGSGALAAWLLWRLPLLNQQVKSFICGFLGIMVSAFILSLVFMVPQYGKGMVAIISVYLPAAIIEGLLTLFIFKYFKKISPELMPK